MEIKIIEPIGLCNSALGILDEIIKNIPNYNNIYVLGDILHNEYVIDYLSKIGIKFVKDLKNIPIDKYSLIILPSHGTSPKIMEKLKKYNYLDLTCPKIKKIHKFIEENDHRDIIFVGNKNHAEIKAVKDYKNVYIIYDEKDVEKLGNLREPIFMCQTTFNEEKFKKLSVILKDKYPHLLIKNTLCNIPIDRIKNINSTECDLLLVVGSKTSSNAMELMKSKPNSRIVSCDKDLDINELKQYKTITVASASSTPIQQVELVLNYLRKNA